MAKRSFKVQDLPPASCRIGCQRGDGVETDLGLRLAGCGGVLPQSPPATSHVGSSGRIAAGPVGPVAASAHGVGHIAVI